MRALIGLGSNLDDPLAQVQQGFDALNNLPTSQLIARSRIYRSKPQGVLDQPDFINAAALIETLLTPLELLDQLQAIEQAHRRIRIQHWGPRTLDLDILLCDSLTIDHPRLKVPHPFLTQRNFVLYPLADIKPDLVLPCGTQLQDLLRKCSLEGLEPLQ